LEDRSYDSSVRLLLSYSGVGKEHAVAMSVPVVWEGFWKQWIRNCVFVHGIVDVVSLAFEGVSQQRFAGATLVPGLDLYLNDVFERCGLRLADFFQ